MRSIGQLTLHAPALFERLQQLLWGLDACLMGFELLLTDRAPTKYARTLSLPTAPLTAFLALSRVSPHMPSTRQA
jgi:hypothetical protein